MPLAWARETDRGHLRGWRALRGVPCERPNQAETRAKRVLTRRAEGDVQLFALRAGVEATFAGGRWVVVVSERIDAGAHLMHPLGVRVVRIGRVIQTLIRAIGEVSAARSEDGGRGAPGRRHRARLQQLAVRHSVLRGLARDGDHGEISLSEGSSHAAPSCASFTCPATPIMRSTQRAACPRMLHFCKSPLPRPHSSVSCARSWTGPD
jgi:hypothetical protein